MVGSSRSTSGTRRAILVSNPVISHKRGKKRVLHTTSIRPIFQKVEIIIETLYQLLSVTIFKIIIMKSVSLSQYVTK
jgi:hypothetical protein